MSTRMFIEAIQRFSRVARSLTNGAVRWLLRNLLRLSRYPRLTQPGFVLPTTVLLLLVLTLTVGSIGYRTYTRAQQTIGERQQRVIYNAASPALDRAKAKLEFMFDRTKDSRIPAGSPPEGYLMSMMLNDGAAIAEYGNQPAPVLDPANIDGDPYTLPGEERIDINEDSRLDNAWRYSGDINNDGVDETVVYSILLSTPASGSDAPLGAADKASVAERASRLQVRHGPLSNATAQNPACDINTDINPERGWTPDTNNPNNLRKNLQVDVFVQRTPANGVNNGTVSTLEFHQDREVRRGIIWGAWFRNDLEIFPGPRFNWNGAMHTEGNLIVGTQSADRFNGYLVSSPKSCFFTKRNSEITVREFGQETLSDGTVRPAFQGQYINGRINTSGTAQSKFHIWSPGAADDTSASTRFNVNTDSAVNGNPPADYALDPVILQTLDFSVARNVTNPSANRDPFWEGGASLRGKGRMRQELSDTTPYVDDFFRADNRYGPKPRYNDTLTIPAGLGIGAEIGNVDDLVRETPPVDGTCEQVGLDGYWERRALCEGMRVIVGQRLELGDPMGWGGPTKNPANNRFSAAFEPLRPWDTCTANSTGRCNEARQRRSLWDNLAAVQGAVVYHSASQDSEEPIACFASAVHPGTATTLANSSTFENLAFGVTNAAGTPAFTPRTDGLVYGQNLPVISDFFRGKGTNGWEFQAPTAAIFGNANWLAALQNLATYAGDPNGGAPSFEPVQDTNVHPFPSMAMWGDFSMLRKVLERLGAVGYGALSPADKTTLHSAACTVGMLAYNVDYLEKFDLDAVNSAVLGIANSTADLNGLRGALRQIRTGQLTVPSTGSPLTIPVTYPYSIANDPQPEFFVRQLERWRDVFPLTDTTNRSILNQYIALARLIITKEQVARDRTWGFLEEDADKYGRAPLGHCALWMGQTGSGTTPPSTIVGTAVTPIGADPDNSEPLRLLCSYRPRYPILYSLFPAKDEVAPFATPLGQDPKQITTHDSATYQPPLIAAYAGFEQHPEEIRLTRDQEDSGNYLLPYILPVNSSNYAIVRPEDVSLLPLGIGSWTLPVEASGTGKTPSNNRDTLIKVCYDTVGVCPFDNRLTNNGNPVTSAFDPVDGSLFRVAFKDTAPFNGREMMSTRMLDVNVDFIRRTQYESDFWLPRSGIIYAFREDAVSEREIVRPTGVGINYSSCDTVNEIITAACGMKTTGSAYASVDPPVNNVNKITTKPVDFHADPERRVHGFRLRNGSTVQRNPQVPEADRRGLSFITDNALYVQGNFNLHQNAGGAPQEEFTQPLDASFNNFYTRSTLNENFARGGDQWLPSELLADAVTILSDNFCDGSIEDGVLTAGLGAGANLGGFYSTLQSYGCINNPTVTSYLNQNRPATNPTVTGYGTRWLRTHPGDSVGLRIAGNGGPAPTEEGSSPIYFDRSGNPMRLQGGTNPSISTARSYTQNYVAISDGKPLISPIAGTRVNAIIISGLVPSRSLQSYGGLHNFPRFLEDWETGSNDLFISGAFLQLNFSNQATGPYDHDAWEVGVTPTSAESIAYYRPPNRRWGYDVGIQYAPASPIAVRFSPPEFTRSEFYSEPPANDPYMRNLCKQIPGNAETDCLEN